MPAPIDCTLLGVTFNRFPDGYMCDKVPEHISLMPWFNDRPNLGSGIRTILRDTAPFTVLPGEPMDLGVPGHEKQGMSVVSDELVALHQKLFSFFVSKGIGFNWPQWIGEGYTPHYTLKNGVNVFDEMSELRVTEIAVIRNVRARRLGGGEKIITYERLRI